MEPGGFYINELRLTGHKKKSASVVFRKGLNIISGPSDTGKTYIFECINYMFGGSDEPPVFDENIGYTTIFLEIESYSGEQRTLKRVIGESRLQLYESRIDEIGPLQNFVDLKDTHDSKDENNISSYLLTFNNIESMKLRKNQRGEKVSFSFRNYTRLIMTSEERIISKISPLLSGRNTEKTSELSAFKAILTGVDDSDREEIEDPKIHRTRLEGKLEIVKSLIKNLSNDLDEKRKTLKDINLNDIEAHIDQLSERITNIGKHINEKMGERKGLWEQEQEIKSRLIMLEELLARFELLKKSYRSDMERLTFIVEGDHYVSQLYDSNCPICNNTINQDAIYFIEHSHATQIENLQKACSEESNKLKSQIADLNDTVNTLNIELQEKLLMADELNRKIEEIDLFIQSELKPVVVIEKEQLKSLFDMKKYFQEIEINEKRIVEYHETQRELIHELGKKNVKLKFVDEISHDIYNGLADEIKKLLEAWNYPDLTGVSFDQKEHDIVVSGKQRKNYGKGYRAILNAAFSIGLMKYTRKNGLKHPGLLILDTPLTTYKERNTADVVLDENEEIPLDMKQAFFKDLSSLKDDYQIIILENIEPLKEVQAGMNYIHFTKVSGVGRYGFIPLNSDSPNF